MPASPGTAPVCRRDEHPRTTPGPGRLDAPPPDLRGVWHALHTRLSTGRPVTRVCLGPLDDSEREALADLLGLDRLPDPLPFVPLTRLEEAVRELSGRTVRQLVTELVGPLGDTAGERRARGEKRARLWAWLVDHPVVRAQPALIEWAASCRASGLAGGSVTRTRALLTDALKVLAEIPCQAEPLPVFAARTLRGHSHTLDDGTPLSTPVLRALYGTDTPQSAAERRELWTRAGVADDERSATVLTAGLRPAGEGLLARLTRACTESGQAASLTLAQVRAPGELALPGALVVHVAENPSVLPLALRRFEPGCPPLVCTSGWPNSVAVFLLRLLAERGAELLYHNVFDGEGVRITAHVMAKTPARPWRMSAADYRTALTRHPGGPDVGRVTPAPWDEELAGALAEQGVAVLEELVADTLMEDWRR